MMMIGISIEKYFVSFEGLLKNRHRTAEAMLFFTKGYEQSESCTLRCRCDC